MKEKILQAKMVMAFSQRYPDQRGLLFAVNNEANSNRQAMTFKALGVFKGASDLIYCLDGKLIAIEVKAPGQKHSRSHIMNQLDWGTRIALAGGEYYIATSVESFLSIINTDISDEVYTLDKIRLLLTESKSTIIFH